MLSPITLIFIGGTRGAPLPLLPRPLPEPFLRPRFAGLLVSREWEELAGESAYSISSMSKVYADWEMFLAARRRDDLRPPPPSSS